MPGRPPSLRAVAAFEAAARHQSFSKAADELNLTHGAISHSIRGLEERLGSRLFERRARGVVLTEAGRALALKVRLSVGLLSEAFEARPWLQRSHLVVSVLPAFAARVLVPLVALFRAAHPEITLDLRMTQRLADLTAGDADVAIRYGPGRWPGVSSFKLADEQIFPVASPLYGSALPAAPEALCVEDLIGHGELPWRPWFAAAGLDRPEPDMRLRIDDSAMLLDAAAAGAGIALGRSVLAASDLRAGRLVRLFETEITAGYAYWLVWNPVSEKQEAIGRFRDWLVAQLQETTRGAHRPPE
jgi:LysR family glycine cleavage system transcriptional activator